MHLKPDYRPDIDGLRAVAVLAVLFYHGGVSFLSGGYVGVDVFFVISGYLITSIIVGEMRSNAFRLTGFYERRVRRIYPALFVMAAFTLLAGAWLFNAGNFAALGKSAAAVTVFLSNVLFWSEAGYFDRASTLKPLLHAWSLSVEEQFYILFPILMLLIGRFGKSRFGRFLGLLWLVSFAWNVYETSRDPSSAFYLMHFRAWELLTGSLLALNILPSRLNAGLRNALALAGMGMILASVFLYHDGTPFPGVAALLPVAGSALTIYSGMKEAAAVHKALSLRPLVFIGKISYSLYLWHWPLLIFLKYYWIVEPPAAALALWLLASFSISTLSWQWIENPFRARTFLSRARLFALAGSVMTLSFAAGAVVSFEDGFPYRFPEALAAEREILFADPVKVCVNQEAQAFGGGVLCRIGAPGQPPRFVLWGDSHAAALAPALHLSALKAEVGGYVLTFSACPPLWGIDRQGPEKGDCYRFNQRVLLFLRQRPEIDTIILSARWAISTEGRRYKAEQGAPVRLVDMLEKRSASNAELFEIGLHRTVAVLAESNRNVVFVTGVPEVGYDVPSAFSIAMRTGRDLNDLIAPTRQDYLERNRAVFQALDMLKKDNLPFQIVDLSLALCDEERCRVTANNQPLYRDDDHLSLYGARYLAWLFDPLFDGMVAR